MSIRLIGAALALTLAGAVLPAAAQGQVAGHETYAREANDLRLGANGLQKCKAFRKVREHTDALQSMDHGTLTAGDTRRLLRELRSAKAMAPKGLTPTKCGVDL